MATKRETYKGHDIEAEEDRQNPRVTIDGKALHVQHLGELGDAYWSHHLAFRHFPTVLELARALVDREEPSR